MDPIGSITSQPSTVAKPQVSEAEQTTGTTQAATVDAKTDQPAVILDLSPTASRLIQTTVRDITPEEQKSWAAKWEKMEESYRKVGWEPAKWLMYVTQDGRTVGMSKDGKVVTQYHRPQTDEEIAAQKAAAAQEQQRKEAFQAAKAEWDAKWDKKQTVTKEPMTEAEASAASDVALTEYMLSSVRDNISVAFRLSGEAQKKTETLNKILAKNGDDGSKAINDLRTSIADTQALIAKTIASFAETQDYFRQYGYKVEGNLVELMADGNYREGTYSLSKTTSRWSMRVDSDKGIQLSIGGQPFTYDFKRATYIDPGQSPVELETPAMYAQRMKSVT